MDLGWTVKKAECQRIDGFELWCWRRLLRVPWTARRSNQSILKEMGPRCSLEGLMLKLNPVLWPPHAKSWLIGKDSDAARDWRQEEKGTTEDEMAEWDHQLDGRESEWTPGVGDGQGGLACCNSWGGKELDTTERLNWTEMIILRTLNALSHLTLKITLRDWDYSSLLCQMMKGLKRLNGTPKFTEFVRNDSNYIIKILSL